jgi:hypothetical protein
MIPIAKINDAISFTFSKNLNVDNPTLGNSNRELHNGIYLSWIKNPQSLQWSERFLEGANID